jgi:hypothetical protein
MDSYEPGSIIRGIEALSAAISAGLQTTAQQPPFCSSNRTYATLNFLPNLSRDPGVENLNPPIETLSAVEQESLLTQELLYLLTGVETSLITIHSVSINKIGFMVSCKSEAKQGG